MRRISALDIGLERDLTPAPFIGLRHLEHNTQKGGNQRIMHLLQAETIREIQMYEGSQTSTGAMGNTRLKVRHRAWPATPAETLYMCSRQRGQCPLSWRGRPPECRRPVVRAKRHSAFEPLGTGKPNPDESMLGLMQTQTVTGRNCSKLNTAYVEVALPTPVQRLLIPSRGSSHHKPQRAAMHKLRPCSKERRRSG